MNIKSHIKSNKRGITLIALVVTIIVIIILACISLYFILGENGLIHKAKDAVSRYKTEGANEITGIESLANELYGELGDEPTIKQEELTQANTNFKYEPEDWTNDKIVVTASTTIDVTSGYSMQVSKDGINYNDGDSLIFEENGTMYVRLWNGQKETGLATAQVEKIDKKAPEIKSLEAIFPGEITINATDEASGIVGYVIKESNETPNISEFTPITSSLTINETVKISQGTTYNVWVIDDADNISTSKIATTSVQQADEVKVYKKVDGIIQNGEPIEQIIIGLGEEVELVEEVLPYDTYNKEVEWSSDDKFTVSITTQGKIKGEQVGNTTIKVTVKNNSGVYKEVEVTVCDHYYMYNYNEYSHYCSSCNKEVQHKYNSNGQCEACEYECMHYMFDYNGVCEACGYKCLHNEGFTEGGTCNKCGYLCIHETYNDQGKKVSTLYPSGGEYHTCYICNMSDYHRWYTEDVGNGMYCDTCKVQCKHEQGFSEDPYSRNAKM